MEYVKCVKCGKETEIDHRKSSVRCKYDYHSQIQLCLYMPKNSYQTWSDAVFRFFRFMFCCRLLDFP